MNGDQEVGEERGKGGKGRGDLVALVVGHLYSTGQHLDLFFHYNSFVDFITHELTEPG